MHMSHLRVSAALDSVKPSDFMVNPTGGSALMPFLVLIVLSHVACWLEVRALQDYCLALSHARLWSPPNRTTLSAIFQTAKTCAPVSSSVQVSRTSAHRQAQHPRQPYRGVRVMTGLLSLPYEVQRLIFSDVPYVHREWQRSWPLLLLCTLDANLPLILPLLQALLHSARLFCQSSASASTAKSSSRLRTSQNCSMRADAWDSPI